MILGKNVALGPIMPQDLVQLFKWYDDPAISRLSETYVPKDWAQHEHFWTNAARDTSRIFFAIRGEGPSIIGTIQISAIEPIHRSAMVGIMIGETSDRGRGLGREAMQLAIDYCWRHLNLSRLSLRVFADNAPAVRLYEGLGFAHEGVMRDALFIDGAWTDLQLMALNHPSRSAAREWETQEPLFCEV